MRASVPVTLPDTVPASEPDTEPDTGPVVDCELTEEQIVKILSWLDDNRNENKVDASDLEAGGESRCTDLDALLGPTAAHLRVLGYLGRGNNGLVLSVLDTTDQGTYAMKLLRLKPPKGERRRWMDKYKIPYFELERITEELAIQAQFAAIGVALPTVGRVHTATIDGKQFAWFLMRRVDTTLVQYMTLPVAEAEMRAVTLAILLLLHRVKAAGFTYADLKPDNLGLVFRGDKAHLYLLDFGTSSVDVAFPAYDYAWLLYRLKPQYTEWGAPKATGERSGQRAQIVANSLAFAAYMRRAVWNVFTHRFPALVDAYFEGAQGGKKRDLEFDAEFEVELDGLCEVLSKTLEDKR